MQGRFLFIDILKGISILLVIYGHIIPGAIPVFTEYAGVFNMPLFFFLSGFLYNEVKYKDNFKEFIYRRYRGLLIPYFYFGIIVAFCYIFIQDDYFTFLKHLLTWGWGGMLCGLSLFCYSHRFFTSRFPNYLFVGDYVFYLLLLLRASFQVGQ